MINNNFKFIDFVLMEIRSFSIDELKKKAVETHSSTLNAVAGAGKGHIGSEPGYSFELGTRSELHKKVGIGLYSVLKQISPFLKSQP